MSSPIISVIIPLYNKAAAVERSVESVLSQSFQDFELIVVDDGSTDGSMEIVERIQDGRILFFRQENGGPSKARNLGVSHAKGKWIVFLDADDELLPGILEHFYQLAKEHLEANVIDCCTTLRTKDGIIQRSHIGKGLSKNDFRDWFFGDLMPGSGHSMFKTSLIRAVPYDEHIRRFEDAELLFRLIPKMCRFRCLRPALLVNTQFASASGARQNIDEDFIGNLPMTGLSFWSRMCMYKFFLGERTYYSEQCRELYPHLYHRYDLFFLYKVLPIFRNFFYS